MATAAVSSNSIYQELQQYFQQRGSDQQALGQALQSGDLAGAQQEYNALQTLAQSGPFANGGAYKVSQRQQDFAAIGQALQAGDLAGAQQAFAQLQSTFKQAQPVGVAQPPIIVTLSGSSPSAAAASPAAPAPTTSTASSAPSGSGSEIVLNLGNVTAGEQIAIGVSNSSNGGEQVTIGVANQQGQTPEQITLNLAQNSNQEIVLNLFNSLASNSAQSSGVNVTA